MYVCIYMYILAHIYRKGTILAQGNYKAAYTYEYIYNCYVYGCKVLMLVYISVHIYSCLHCLHTLM